MKIVVLGSHGTGKTTLAKKLYGYLAVNYNLNVNSVKLAKRNRQKIVNRPIGELRWTYLPEAPFEATQKGFTMNEETSLESELWIFSKQLELEKTSAPWIADKCLIDILAYARYLFKNEPELINIFERIVRKNMKYDLVLYLPTGEFPLENDGLRSLDLDFQKNIDNEVLKVMKDYDIKYHRVKGDKEERFNKAKRIINKHF